MDACEELRILAEQVRHHEKADRAGKAEITDGTFDELFDRYVALADELGVPEAERLDHALSTARWPRWARAPQARRAT